MVVRKRFGQHFLHDPAVIRRIMDAVAPSCAERIVELGPGRGALTWGLLERAAELTVIEIDRDLAASLERDARANARLRVLVGDMLEVDFERLRAGGAASADGPLPPVRELRPEATKLRIVGNLPYNISTPILFHLLRQRDAIADMHLMVQKEVADRMVAEPGSKQYGRLTVMLAAYADVEKLFEVGPGAFQPRPKVWSAMVRVRPSLEPRFSIGGDAVLKSLVSAAFSHRRKTLRNGLKALMSSQDIETCGIDPRLRPESLTPEGFGRLATRLSQLAGMARHGG
ncbi:MAG TPA: 16S rRNA (adenine(1518)-N(6)/adenine(1519)-N(6))-dimethyltransferase RsmA [Steroidobacteraceae bacterium]|nr:16S rRNA (adenine(1518)-N(6)/adenine(1519)-N(6))-dimethyltransferase RsmA [Steroidobacteraceae bacterium]